MAEVPI